jgi:hypothetical protein
MLMTLDAMVLQRIADWRPSGTGRELLSIQDPSSGWIVQLVSDRQAEFSIALWEMEIRWSGNLATNPLQALTQWARHVSNLSGLLESVPIVEIDHQRIQALLRSTEPAQRDGHGFYYEILLEADRGASVRRYQCAKPGIRREQVAFVLTHEALAKLVREVVAGHHSPKRLL